MNERFQWMLDWLDALPILQGRAVSQPVSASSDASFRRYFRIEVNGPQEKDLASYIIMDAPPEHEDCEPFIHVSAQMAKLGLNVPKVLAQNLQQGFLLLTDLGSTTYLSVLNSADESEVDRLYCDALNALVILQEKGAQAAPELPAYDETLLNNEMNLFSDWLLGTHLEMPLSVHQQMDWQQIKTLLTQSALAQPKTYVHRDYHSRNLMVTSQGNPGILDFQDAVYGPLTYDAVSLLRDCYIAWPSDQVREWQRYYFLKLCEVNLLKRDEWHGFLKAMDFMGIQRHLKASGIFARLYHRDGKDGYLNDIPQTLQYIVDVGRDYPEMKWLVEWVENRMLPHTLLQKAG
ncbi:phosphotransferase [Thiomicrorhabdus sp. zzn3]|uniref:aminoglycoside phosphotransferase family protein n=1 Tax=Thiomicrorhabdus sp. zzn3 TaxID=3039775 RepID=UPI00243655EB|nr:phosphotransferase [Thiomicrorhabdus sp. zzn3]MDG6777483.1 phosphotransferase [Thiomicrorhabdus sp. zzn3]